MPNKSQELPCEIMAPTETASLEIAKRVAEIVEQGVDMSGVERVEITAKPLVFHEITVTVYPK